MCLIGGGLIREDGPLFGGLIGVASIVVVAVADLGDAREDGARRFLAEIDRLHLRAQCMRRGAMGGWHVLRVMGGWHALKAMGGWHVLRVMGEWEALRDMDMGEFPRAMRMGRDAWDVVHSRTGEA